MKPRSYREVIGQTIQHLRPHLEVAVIEPDALSAEIRRLAPDLVICSQPNTLVAKCEAIWVEFHPAAEPSARILIDGRYLEQDDVSLEDLLAIIDRTTDSGYRGALQDRCMRSKGGFLEH